MTVLASPAEPLLGMLSPRVCPECGQFVPPQAADMANAAADAANAFASLFAAGMRQLLAPMAGPGTAATAGPWTVPAAHRHGPGGLTAFHRGHGRRDCGCGDRGHMHEHGWEGHAPGKDWRRECWACSDDCRCCEDELCECRCCIPRSDLLVYARAGETRVVPLVIENRRHRERHITLHISDWKVAGTSGADVTTVDLEPADFELKACSREVVRLRFSVVDDEHRDVETCTVACADLTVDGCDVKPLRIAAAILPAECEPYRVDCSCGCC